MPANCRGICSRLRSKVENRIAYKTGHKRCIYCDVYFKTDDLRCPCCSSRLRSNARNSSVRDERYKRLSS